MVRNLVMALAALLVSACSFGGVGGGANDGFGVLSGIESGRSFYEFDLVRSSSPGEVRIIDRQGTVLGSADVGAGTNSNVRVTFTRVIGGQDLTAQLLHGGGVVLEDTIPVTRRP
ncbi:MAG: hypothetical protein AAGH70_01520 [Pseudomonadota bacterium]